MIFFQINGRSVASPKDLSHSYVELDKMERKMDGTMVVDVIGKKKKLEVTWDYLTKENMQVLSEEVMTGSFVTINYKNNTDGNTATITALPKDFSYSPAYDWKNDKIYWKSVSIAFEER